MNKTFKLEIKGFGEQGSFTGMASVYGNKDLGGDVVEPGAFAKTLSEKGGQVPILWQHDPSEPIGMGALTDSADGLQISGDLAIDSSPVAQKAYGLLKRGILKGLSIGYDTVRSDVKNGFRYLKELKLWEVSIVTFPMNEMATVFGIKAFNGQGCTTCGCCGECDCNCTDTVCNCSQGCGCGCGMDAGMGMMSRHRTGEFAAFIEQEKLKFKALFEQYAAELKAPTVEAAAMHDKNAPEILHPSLDRILQLLRS